MRRQVESGFSFASGFFGIEVIADGLSLWQGAQLAINTTLVFSSPAGWDSKEGSCKTRRGGFGGSAPKERVHIPRVGRRGWTSAAGGVGGRNRGSMVSRDGPFPPKSRQAKAETALLLMQKRVQGALVEEMERHLGVQRRQGVRFVSS